MATLEKQLVYIPDGMLRALDRDAELFEVFKKDGRIINRNRFLNSILSGYSAAFDAERSELETVIASELIDAVADASERRRLSHKIIRELYSRNPLELKGRKTERLQIKPTKETEFLIKTTISDLGDDTVSSYYRGLFASYLSKPSFERERIVFKNKVETLVDACSRRQTVKFTTIWDPGTIHTVIPYKLLSGFDGQFNYLLCYEESNADRPALSYRLSRISGLNVRVSFKAIPTDVECHLARMEQLGPQFAINDDEEVCVRLTEAGQIDFRRIYFGRPLPERIEQDGDAFLYYFQCSQDQLFLYFRRFNPSTAEVVVPASLRHRLAVFHGAAYKAYSVARPNDLNAFN